MVFFLYLFGYLLPKGFDKLREFEVSWCSSDCLFTFKDCNPIAGLKTGNDREHTFICESLQLSREEGVERIRAEFMKLPTYTKQGETRKLRMIVELLLERLVLVVRVEFLWDLEVHFRLIVVVVRRLEVPLCELGRS